MADRRFDATGIVFGVIYIAIGVWLAAFLVQGTIDYFNGKDRAPHTSRLR